MHEGMLAVAADEGADRFHGPSAVAGPIPGNATVDVARVQAVRTVVAVPAPGGDRADHRLAVGASERFLEVAPAGAPGLPRMSGCVLRLVAGVSIGARQRVVLHRRAPRRQSSDGRKAREWVLWSEVHTRTRFVVTMNRLSIYPARSAGRFQYKPTKDSRPPRSSTATRHASPRKRAEARDTAGGDGDPRDAPSGGGESQRARAGENASVGLLSPARQEEPQELQSSRSRRST
jgi:hypothetical protein